MTSISLNTGLRALLSAQQVLDTIGHNISNANTPGYSRQQVDLAAALPLQVRGLLIGTGVNATVVQRSVDALLGRRILGHVSLGGELDARQTGLSQLEALLGDLGGGGGIGGDISSFFGSLSELSTAPEDPILRTSAVQSALAMTASFNQLAGNLGGVRSDAVGELRTRVAQVNGLTGQIAQLNLQIGQTESAGVPANDLRDQRDRLLGQLAAQVDVSSQEDDRGQLTVLAGGQVLVSSGRSNDLEIDAGDQNVQLRVKGSSRNLTDPGGAIGGLIGLHDGYVPGFASKLDDLARQLVLQVNRAHSTAIPAGGGFKSLSAANPLQDRDGDGRLDDELVSRAGLPFDVSSGAFYVNIVDEGTGDVTKHRIDVDASHTTVGQLLSDLNAIPELSAGLDAQGRLTLLASSGKRFDFSARLDANPDTAETFGSAHASLGSAQGPFALSDGDTLDLTVDPSGAAIPLSISFSSASFGDISEASADELAAAINADPNAQSSGIRGKAVDGRLFLQSVATGSSVAFRLDGGSATSALGWSGAVGTTVTGHDNSVDVHLSGAYTGTGEDVYTFRPNQDGTIGTTPGLAVDVIDSSGRVVTSLDVGEGYVPGTNLDVGNGVQVSFELGQLSASNNDTFSIQLVSDSDTTDALVAFGLNSLLVGNDAASISVRKDLVQDPSLLATSGSGASGDSSAVLSILDAQSHHISELGGATLGQYYGDLVGDVGFQVSSTSSAIDSNASLVSSLQARQQQVSGVNIDEELTNLLQYQQSFAAAAQYITVVNQVGQDLLNIL